MKKNEKIKLEIESRQRQIVQINTKLAPIRTRMNEISSERQEHILGLADGIEGAAARLEKLDSENLRHQRDIQNHEAAIGIIRSKITALEQDRDAALKDEKYEELKELVRKYEKLASGIEPAIDKMIEILAAFDGTAQAIDERARMVNPAVFTHGRINTQAQAHSTIIATLFEKLTEKLGRIPGIPFGWPTGVQTVGEHVKNIASHV